MEVEGGRGGDRKERNWERVEEGEEKFICCFDIVNLKLPMANWQMQDSHPSTTKTPIAILGSEEDF